MTRYQSEGTIDAGIERDANGEWRGTTRDVGKDEPINPQACREMIIAVQPWHPLGAFNTVYLNEDEEAGYSADPDAWCAEYYSIPVEVYRE